MSGHVLPFPTPTRVAITARRGGSAGRARAPHPWLDLFLVALRVAEGRRALAAMDDRMLADIGLSRAEALAEASRAPWDLAPSARRR